MKSSNSLHNQQPFVANKKLIIHFDVDNVLRINSSHKDLYVCIVDNQRYMNCVRNGFGVNYKRIVNKMPKK